MNIRVTRALARDLKVGEAVTSLSHAQALHLQDKLRKLGRRGKRRYQGGELYTVERVEDMTPETPRIE